MRRVRSLMAEDFLVLGSLALTLAGITLGALLAAPAAFGVTALLVFVLLLAGQYVSGSPRLAWLLAFGLVAGVVELWADWVHVTQLHTLVYTTTSASGCWPRPPTCPSRGASWWRSSATSRCGLRSFCRRG